jgi:hypothetical protein
VEKWELCRYPTALFSEQPVFGTARTRVTIEIRLLQPQDRDVGLLLLLLKALYSVNAKCYNLDKNMKQSGELKWQ